MTSAYLPPEATVVVCPHWQTDCRDEEPVGYAYWDSREPPLCHNRHVMDVRVKLRDWRIGVGWPR